jgi:Uma2 family endonuclease
MATTQLMTVEELEREGAPEGRWELIDGELVEMSPSGSLASSIAAGIVFLLYGFVTPRRLGTVYGADGGFVLFPGREILRVPDVAFVRAERLPAEEDQVGFLRLAPDLAVEVLSPSERPGDIAAKVQMYLDAGVRLVWLVDPRARTVMVHAPATHVRILGESDEIDGGDVLPGFQVAVADLFPSSPAR